MLPLSFCGLVRQPAKYRSDKHNLSMYMYVYVGIIIGVVNKNKSTRRPRAPHLPRLEDSDARQPGRSAPHLPRLETRGAMRDSRSACGHALGNERVAGSEQPRGGDEQAIEDGAVDPVLEQHATTSSGSETTPPFRCDAASGAPARSPPPPAAAPPAPSRRFLHRAAFLLCTSSLGTTVGAWSGSDDVCPAHRRPISEADEATGSAEPARSTLQCLLDVADAGCGLPLGICGLNTSAHSIKMG